LFDPENLSLSQTWRISKTPTDLTLDFTGSTNLESGIWNGQGISTTRQSENAAFQTWQVDFSPSSAAQGYLRLEATLSGDDAESL
jgi:hypothetical protein